MYFDYRHTKIIFTLGPATESEEMLRDMIVTGGVDVCRLNMAHANHEWTEKIIARVRKVCSDVNRHVAIMMDVKGPEIRTGDQPEPIELEAGELFDFLVSGDRSALEQGVRGVTVNYPRLHNDVRVGDTLLVDSGLVRMQIEEIREDRVRCKVIIPGPMGNRRHINLPGVKVNLPALTQKDKADIEVGIKHNIEFFALSFVREADDLDILRRHLKSLNSDARIIAKIEDQSAISNLDEIITAADALMVARGDLGIECPYEELPLIQRRAVKACIQKKKPVIIATHMLESMIEQPIPTRAEVTDIANAVFEKADCIMLSGETTTGKYPVECARVMNRIARQVERSREAKDYENIPLNKPKAKMLRAAVHLAQDMNKAGIVVFTRSGYLPQILSALRPTRVPIFAFTDQPLIFKQMLLMWGVEPFMIEFGEDSESTIKAAFERLYTGRIEWASPGDWMVVITNILVGEHIIDSIQLRQVE
ncbi:MAG: pyruvate kinase [Verrucomicrobiota bacterium JB024]|nr:pyruvate kinase [Verrucomicrobiota bacterium JB024]